MTLPNNIQPRYVIAATAAVAVLMIGSGVVELHQSRSEIYHLLGESALALAETIDRSGANNLLSTETMEDLLAERLLDNAVYIARLDSAVVLRQQDLSRLAEEHHLFRINMFDRQGKKTLSSHSPSIVHEQLPEKYSPVQVLAPLLKGSADRLVLGLKDARVEDGQRYAVAVRRTRPSGGAIVVNLDAADLLQFRRTIGIGKLLKDLGNNSGIAYVALQDTQGILAAGGVRELSSIRSDSLVARVLFTDTTIMRVQPFDSTEVFEVVRPFAPEGVHIGVLRIGLTMDEVRTAELRMLRRTVIMSVIVLVIGTLAFVFLIAQQNYREMERRYRLIRTYTGNILSQMRDGVVTLEPTGRVTIINIHGAKLLGIQAEDVEGRALAEFTGSGMEMLKEVFAAADGSFERTVDLAGSDQRIMEISLSTIRDATGAVESRTAVLRDVTEARRVERETNRNSKLTAMGELASAVAHEIRNPLNAIGMIAQRFSKEFTPRTGVNEYRTLTSVMYRETQRVNRIINQFLSFARPRKIARQQVSVSKLITVVASLFESQAKAKDVDFTASAETSESAFLDPELIKQALLNLLQNALDATPVGGHIALVATRESGGVRIAVEDNGIGLSPTDMEKIFNLYHTTKPNGVGLGLPITHQIVIQHGGTIDVSSVEGEGTTFTIQIPA